MKILWISHFLLYPDVGFGALQRSKNLLIETSKKNDIFLVSFYKQNQSNVLSIAKDNLNKYSFKQIYIELPVKNKFILFLKSISSVLPVSVNIYRSKKFQYKILRILKDEKIDIIYSDTIGLIENKLNKIQIPKILNHHNIESSMMNLRSQREPKLFLKLFFKIEALKLRHYERKYCNKYNINIVVSESDKILLNQIDNRLKIKIIENGVAEKNFNYYKKTKLTNNILFIGGLDWYPNLDAIVYFYNYIWKSLIKDLPSLKLKIIGKLIKSSFLDSMGKDPSIEILGYVDDLKPYYKYSSVFICPIRDGGGTKLKVLDAMANSIPIVSTSFCSCGIDAKNGINILIADKPNEFVKQIKKLISNLSLQNYLATNAFALVRRQYSYDTIGSKLNSLFQDLQR